MTGSLVRMLCASLLLFLVVGSADAARSASAPQCTPTATKELVQRFVAAYGTGRVAVADRLWAPAPGFRWFSAGAPGRRLGPAAYQRATLPSHFRARARRHEHLRVVALRAGYDDARELVHFAGKLVRSADDVRSRTIDFKGAADCVSGTPQLIVWSM